LVALYVASLEKGSGKTAICAGLGKHLLNDGKKIGFLKPIIAGSKDLPGEGTDSDAIFMKQLLSLEEPVAILCPVLSDKDNLAASIKEAYARVSQGKDVVIIEGLSEQNQASHNMAEALDAKVIIVESYSSELLKAADKYKGFGKSLLGVVLNKVPRNQAEQVHGEASIQADKAGVNILGVLPEDRILLALTMGELAGRIQGEILRGAEQSAELMENLMLGALAVDHGPDYFGRKDNKAIVVKSDRPDMQLAAIQTSTRCLVLTGDTPLTPVVLDRAEEKDIPIIIAKDDTATIVTNIEDALGKTKFNQTNKLPRLSEIMEQHFHFREVYKALGLSSS